MLDKKKFLVAVLIAIFIWMAYRWMDKQVDQTEGTDDQSSSQSEQRAEPELKKVSPTEKSSAQTDLGISLDISLDIPIEHPVFQETRVRQDEAFSFEIELPDLRKVREEAGMNSHETPPSLMQFAISLVDPMERAKESLQAAQMAFEELEYCVASMGREGLPQVQMVCFSNLSRLADWYPEEFEGAFERVRDSHPEVARISELLREHED
jgi:hypothetical protein